jgi:hypothetical protein
MSISARTRQSTWSTDAPEASTGSGPQFCEGPRARRAIEEDRFPRAPRLAPLRSALAKLDPAAAAVLRRPPVKTPSLTPEPPKAGGRRLADRRALMGQNPISLMSFDVKRPLQMARGRSQLGG